MKYTIVGLIEKKSHGAFAILLAFPLLIFSLQCLRSLQHQSPTYDEVLYIPAGYSFLQTGTLLTNPETQPLPRILTAIGLSFMHLNYDAKDIPPFKARFQWSADFLFRRNAARTEEIVFRARIPSVLMGVALLAGLAFWTRSLFGTPAALAAVTLGSLEPNLIAHASLATADLPLTAFYFFAVLSFWRWLENPQSKGAIIVAGCILGAAFLCKSSGLFLVPVFALLWLGYALLGNRRHFSIQSVLSLLFIFSISFLFINVVFLFQGTFTQKTEMIQMTLGGTNPGLLRWLVYFLPDQYSFPLLFNAAQSLGQFHPFPYFLNGNLSTQGFWYYFLEAIAIKTPLPLLLAFLVSAVLLCLQAPKRPTLLLLIPFLFPILYFSFFNKLDLGLRYILPAFPFLLMIAGSVFELAVRFSKKALSFVFVILLIWNAWSVVRISPHYLAYFNEIVGGPANGYRFLVDSNLDWGQDLMNLKKFMDEKKIECVNLSYFGTADPLHYGICYRYLPSPAFQPWTIRHLAEGKNPFAPSRGIYAISATNLQGLYLPDVNTFRVFRDRVPDAMVGYSILIYSYP